MGVWLGKTHPREINEPPPSLAPPPITVDNVGGVISGRRVIPPTYVYTQRREPIGGQSFLMVPWDQYNQEYELPIGWHEAPDPIRQSDFYAAGNKVKPCAHMRIVTHLAIGSRESVSEQQFRIGKLLGYLHRPMYALGQHPSVIRANIEEAVPSTYGSQYQVRGVQPAGGIVTPTGFSVPLSTSSTVDGYPY